MPLRSTPRFRTLLHGEDDMHKLRYERLTQFAVLMLLAPALVSEIVIATGGSSETGTGHWLLISTIVLVTGAYFLANFFIARTFHRSGSGGKWPVAIASVSAIVAFASFFTSSFGILNEYGTVRDVLGDLGFIGMGYVSAYAIGYDLLVARKVTSREVWGSIALYMIVGVTFSYVYGLITILNETAFSEIFEPGIFSRPDLIYFSFVTQMSVGFGDIVPVSPLARNVVILHGAFGILYPPILIARLVNLFMAGRDED